MPYAALPYLVIVSFCSTDALIQHFSGLWCPPCTADAAHDTGKWLVMASLLLVTSWFGDHTGCYKGSGWAWGPFQVYLGAVLRSSASQAWQKLCLGALPAKPLTAVCNIPDGVAAGWCPRERAAMHTLGTPSLSHSSLLLHTCALLPFLIRWMERKELVEASKKIGAHLHPPPTNGPDLQHHPPPPHTHCNAQTGFWLAHAQIHSGAAAPLQRHTPISLEPSFSPPNRCELQIVVLICMNNF